MLPEIERFRWDKCNCVGASIGQEMAERVAHPSKWKCMTYLRELTFCMEDNAASFADEYLFPTWTEYPMYVE